ncbi:MAG: TatD family deoxyribonuclease [Ruminococcaceae bacterium]|nr:TatD family deoxyribonuclease [Oscillospiraceae bacterium]
MLFDTHAHYYDKKFDPDRDSLLSTMRENGVGYILNAGCDIETTKKSIALAEKYKFMYAAAGIHPNHTQDMNDDGYNAIRLLAKHPKVKAIGEIGLDYFYDYTDRQTQRDAFARQIDIARVLNLPFVIHCRDACKDTLDILRSEYRGGGALMHCFSESVETARIVLNMGLTIAIGGTVTFKNNVRTVEAVKFIPLENLVIETDSPYLSPVPHRGERNSSLNIHFVAEKIAQIKGVSPSLVEEITTENAKQFFGI